MASVEEHSGDGSALGINNGHNGDAHATLSLDECRMAALAVIDEAPLTWFHFKLCMVAGVGFFTDAYDLFVINIASTMLNYLPESHGKLSPVQDFYLKVSAPVGTIIGALIFGWLADPFGRKKMYGIELIIMIISTFAQALTGATRAVNLITALVVWRFIMGVGIGGDYPLSAIIVSEFSPIRIRGRLMAVVVASQGWGNLTASLVALVVVAAFRNSLNASGTTPIDDMWRLLIGLGCIPAVIGLFFRLTVPETPRFTADIERNLDQARADIKTSLKRGEVYEAEFIRRITVPKASWTDFIKYFSKWDNFKVLFGASYSWFAIDVSFYGLGLNNSAILQQTIFQITASQQAALGVYDTLYIASVYNIIIAVAGLIPGYWVTFLFIDKWGRKPIQLMGFTILAVLYIVTGAVFDEMIASNAGMKAMVFLYCLGNFFQNFGPNTTTFIIPGELFPTRYRSTCHGIAAASGKLGATVSLVIFYVIKQNDNNTFFKQLLLILGCFMLTGIGSTLWVPETKDKSLEELSNERQQGFVQGYADRGAQMRQMEA